MITELNEQDCLDLLRATTVGRVAFVADGRVLIIPVNFVLDGHDVILRTAPDGILAELPSSRELIAFEVDHHDDLSGSGWSVLLSTRAGVMSNEELEAVPGVRRVRAWAEGDRSLALRLTPESISGRRVRRSRR